jgi:hypothetical protein
VEKSDALIWWQTKGFEGPDEILLARGVSPKTCFFVMKA